MYLSRNSFRYDPHLGIFYDAGQVIHYCDPNIPDQGQLLYDGRLAYLERTALVILGLEEAAPGDVVEIMGHRLLVIFDDPISDSFGVMSDELPQAHRLLMLELQSRAMFAIRRSAFSIAIDTWPQGA